MVVRRNVWRQPVGNAACMAILSEPTLPPSTARRARLGGATPLSAADGPVQVFAREPDLLAGVDPATAEVLRRRVAVATCRLPEGEWEPPSDPDPSELGLLVLDGLLIRCVSLDGRECPELVGSGDLLRPWDGQELLSLSHTTSWRVLQPTRLAVLDRNFAAIAGRFPTIVSALLSRSMERSRAISLNLAIAHVRQARPRLLMLLWHLADRWGRVTPSGVLVPLPLTHELLARLTCMRRPTASTALQELTRSGDLERQPDGGWLLTGDPPQAATAA